MMWSPTTEDQREKEHAEVIARAKKALEYVREKGKLPRNLGVWESLELQRLAREDKTFPYSISCEITE